MTGPGERGEVSLPGLLMASAIFLVVLLATLTTYDAFARDQHETTRAVEAQDAARRAVDTLARTLRNLSSPTQSQPEAVDHASAYDLVFKTVDAVGPNSGANLLNVQRVRYCLDAASPARLVRQVQSWTTASPPQVPSTAACPGTGWGETSTVAEALVNRTEVPPRPLFTVDSTVLTSISAIHVDLAVDHEPTREPGPVLISTGLFLRNQNRRPTAQLTATRTPQGVLLNGSTSQDPEGEPLTYTWWRDGAQIGAGIVTTVAVPAGTPATFELRVTDPAGLQGTATGSVPG